MKARLYLAALDWNSQTREVKRDCDGQVVESVVWSKKRKRWVKRVQYVKTSGNHVVPLMKKVIETKREGLVLPKMQQPKNLPKYVAAEPKPEPSDIERKSRFGK
jgi:hypothetical protein